MSGILVPPELPPAAGPSLAEGGEIAQVGSRWKLWLLSFKENKLAVVGVAIVVFFVLFCFVGPLVYHTDQFDVNFSASDQPPGNGYPLGTDGYGFDVLGRIMLGGQASLEIGLFAAFIATAVGTLYGTISGLVGGVVDAVMMRIVDIILSIPLLFIVLIVATQFPPTVISLSLIIGLFSWLTPARLVRGEVLTLKNRDFVLASRVMGAGTWRLARRHLIPNALGVVVVNITFQVADAILLVATLGFLGFGIQYPQADWGDMLSSGTTFAFDGYWWLIFPVGACLVAVVMAFNFIGDAARDALEVRLRQR